MLKADPDYDILVTRYIQSNPTARPAFLRLPLLRMRRHNRLALRAQRILPPPQTRHRLRLRPKRHARLAIERARPAARHALLVPCERPQRQRHRHRHVDAHLPGLHVAHKDLRGRPAAREDGGAVAVFVGVDERDGRGERVGREADEFVEGGGCGWGGEPDGYADAFVRGEMEGSRAELLG